VANQSKRYCRNHGPEVLEGLSGVQQTSIGATKADEDADLKNGRIPLSVPTRSEHQARLPVSKVQAERKDAFFEARKAEESCHLQQGYHQLYTKV
jgi:hypothetical protein